MISLFTELYMVLLYVLTAIIHRINTLCMLVIHLELCCAEIIMSPFGGFRLKKRPRIKPLSLWQVNLLLAVPSPVNKFHLLSFAIDRNFQSSTDNTNIILSGIYNTLCETQTCQRYAIPENWPSHLLCDLTRTAYEETFEVLLLPLNCLKTLASYC